jgi:hypothetical protein
MTGVARSNMRRSEWAVADSEGAREADSPRGGKTIAVSQPRRSHSERETKGGCGLTLATLAKSLRSTGGTARVAITLVGVLGVSAIATQVGWFGHTANAATGLHYQRGYSVQQGWLCYGWSSGAYHCTRRWHRSSGRLISDNAPWVPNAGAAAPAASRGGAITYAAGIGAPAQAGQVQAVNSAGEPCRSSDYFNGVPSQWAVPPSCYGGVYSINPANYVYRPGFGWCNWWPEVMNPSRPNLLWGNYPRGTTPRPGATVVFAPGVQGASAGGHYGRVVAIYPGGGWILISEMNFTWRGAGFGRVNYRFVRTGPGVTYIY